MTMLKNKLDYKWVVLLLVSIAYFLAQGTRLIYSAVLPQIKADFAASGVNDTQLGLISSTFTLVFGLVMPFAGLAADLFNRKRVLVLGSFMFAIGIFVSGFATGLGMLFISYGIINAIGQVLLLKNQQTLHRFLQILEKGMFCLLMKYIDLIIR